MADQLTLGGNRPSGNLPATQQGESIVLTEPGSTYDTVNKRPYKDMQNLVNQIERQDELVPNSPVNDIAILKNTRYVYTRRLVRQEDKSMKRTGDPYIAFFPGQWLSPAEKKQADAWLKEFADLNHEQNRALEENGYANNFEPAEQRADLVRTDNS
jgi:hypothetical protein